MAETAVHNLISTSVTAVTWLGARTIRVAKDIGAVGIFFGEIMRLATRKPFRSRLLFQQLEFIGNQSLTIIMMTGFFTGAVFGLQIGGIFQIFRAEGMLGAATGKALARELAPLMTAFLMSGRAGSAMTAEISTMKVNEQLDAMEAMAVDPVSYLVVPRFLAAVIIIPFLCAIFMFTGVIGAYVTGVGLFDVDVGVFLEKITWLVQPIDIWNGLEKVVVFAAIVATVACRYGLRASGGAKGVGNATTDSVVVTLLTVLAFDVVITYIQVRW